MLKSSQPNQEWILNEILVFVHLVRFGDIGWVDSFSTYLVFPLPQNISLERKLCRLFCHESLKLLTDFIRQVMDITSCSDLIFFLSGIFDVKFKNFGIDLTICDTECFKSSESLPSFRNGQGCLLWKWSL